MEVKKFREYLTAEIRDIASILGLNEAQQKQYLAKYMEEFEAEKASLKTFPFRHNGIIRNASYHDLIDKVIEKNPDGIILASNGAIFQAKASPGKDFLTLQLNQRKVAKKEMLKFKSEGDKAKASVKETQQLKFKESANSLYGLLNLTAFFLYHPDCAGAITAGGRQQAFNIISNIEASLGNRPIFESFNDVVQFLTRNSCAYICKQTKVSEDEFIEIYNRELLKRFEETTESFITRLLPSFKFEYSEHEIFMLQEMISGLFRSEANRLRFGLFGRIKELYTHSKTFQDGIEYNHFPENPDDFSEGDWHKFNTDLVTIIKFTVLYSLPEAESIARNYKREAVILSDTDSTYCKFEDLFNLIIDHQKTRDLSLEQKEVIAFRIVDVIGQAITGTTLNEMNEQFWRSDSQVNSWKSEFAFRTIIITSAKKNYAYQAVVQEGYPVDVKDNKGFFKSGFSSFSNEFIVELIESIFKAVPSEIYGRVFKSFTNGRRKLEEAISAGEHIAYARLKYGHAAKYADPWGQYQHTAGAINNLLFPEEKALSGERVSFVKLIVPQISQSTDPEVAFNKYLDFLEEKSGKPFREKVEKALSDSPNFKEWFGRNGLKHIGMPIVIDKIPQEIVNLVDRETIISENLFSRTGNFLELLGIESGTGSKGVYGGGCLKIKEYL